MVETDKDTKPILTHPIVLRKLTKSGGTKYLSVGSILPLNWVNVKVTINQVTPTQCILTLDQIK